RISMRGYNPTLGQSVIPTALGCVCAGKPAGYNPTLGQSVIPTKGVFIATQCTQVTIPRSGNPSFRPHQQLPWRDGIQIVTIPRSGNPSFRRLLPASLERLESCYNPTLGQSVIPTPSYFSHTKGPGVLQSHARAIRHSDLVASPGKSAAIAGYNPTLGQSVIPTGTSVLPYVAYCGYNPTLGQSVIPTPFVAILPQIDEMLQSHARAIRHSDNHFYCDPQPANGGYNPTLGQSVIPTKRGGPHHRRNGRGY